MSSLDIAQRAGLAKSTVQKISRLNSWATVSLATYDKFVAGCGVDPMRTGEHLRFWRRRKWAFMERATASQRKLYSDLLSA